jgi:hypothetical protein
MCSTGSLPEFNAGSGSCKDLSKPESLSHDDSKCASVCQCCVGMSDYGDSNKCTSACRKCRAFGDTWQPRRPMQALDYKDVYNDLPGYSTTGDFVEHFSVGGIPIDGLTLFAIIALFFAGATLSGAVHFGPQDGLMWTIATFVIIKLMSGQRNN